MKYIRIEIPRNRLSSGIVKVYLGTHFLPIRHAPDVDLGEARGHQPDQCSINAEMYARVRVNRDKYLGKVLVFEKVHNICGF